jgi:outer membrane murein-binding lipoprotein Lpp
VTLPVGLFNESFMKHLSVVTAILGAILVTTLMAGCTSTKKISREIGHTSRDVSREVGHATRDTAREIGHATRDAAKAVDKKIDEAITRDL